MNMSTTTLQQAKEKRDKIHSDWWRLGCPRGYNALNDSNIEVIKAYMNENPNALGYNYEEFVELKADGLCDYCCNYIFNGTAENIEKIKAAEMLDEFGLNKDIDKLVDTLMEIGGISLIWSKPKKMD